MKNFFLVVNGIYDRMVEYASYLAAAILVLVAVFISLDVVLRSAFNWPLMWVFEGTEYALLFITFLATTYALRKEEHVRLDLLLNIMGGTFRARFNSAMSVVTAIVCLIITWSSANYTIYLFQNDVMIIKYYTIPQFTIYFIIPIGFFLLTIESLKKAYQFLRPS